MRLRNFNLHPADFSPAECRQIIALVNAIGKACNGKPADVVGVALQAIIADVTLTCADDEASCHEGVDHFARDVKGMISDALVQTATAH